jgi:hypothetical protein
LNYWTSEWVNCLNNYWVLLSVIVRGRVDYSDPAQVARINQLLLDLEASHYINPHLTKSWLRSDNNNTLRLVIRIHNETGSNHGSLLFHFQIISTSFAQKEGKKRKRSLRKLVSGLLFVSSRQLLQKTIRSPLTFEKSCLYYVYRTFGGRCHNFFFFSFIRWWSYQSIGHTLFCLIFALWIYLEVTGNLLAEELSCGDWFGVKASWGIVTFPQRDSNPCLTHQLL